MPNNLRDVYWMLRLGLGATAVVAGADKFFNRLIDWEQYLSPMAERNLPMSGSTFMKLVGVIEIAAGGLILGKRPRLGGYIVSAWLLAIAANLVTEQDWYDIAARDVNMALAAYALARLAAEQENARAAHLPAELREKPAARSFQVRESGRVA
jgi:uncharacterized membrane protein YphA (DoxX/SURF4 family)